MGFTEYYTCVNKERHGIAFAIKKYDDKRLVERLKSDELEKFVNGYKNDDYLFRDLRDERKIKFDNTISVLLDHGKKEEIKDFYKQNLYIKFNANFSENAFIIFPLWYYPGYKAHICSQICQELQLITGPLHRISAYIPKGKHSIEIFFSEKWQWRLAEFISIITIIFLIVKQLLKSRGLKYFIRFIYIKNIQ